MKKTRLAGYALLMLCVLCAAGVLPAAAQGGTLAAITAPQDGEEVRGVVTITGSASDTQFEAYQLWFALSGTDQWFPLTRPIQTPVQAGALGTWDTSGLPPGAYRLRLQVFVAGSDSAVEALVENITVQPVQTDIPATATTPANTPLPPTDIPSLAEPPAAAPPGSAAEAGPVEVTTAQSDEADLSVRTAFCGGALFAAVTFAIMGAYTVIRARTRFARRRFIASLEDDA
ncbi:MAG: hypothetical protein JXO22_10280 [Phycisphaerae bacterium]|nr:hypothetical protein [Phycisphaerae bacterium]